MEKVTCIDVSTFQKNIDFKKVKAAGITAVIIRAGYGREVSQKDNEFETHYKNAKAAGLKIGAYWYSYADSVNDAKKEADACLACIKGKTFDLPVYYDMEDSSQTKLGKTTLTSIAKAFCDAVIKGGFRAGVYANLNWFNNYLDYSALKKLYSIWLAQYNYVNDKDCDIWQNSSTGKINGISGNVDTNIIYNNNVLSTVPKTKTLDTKGYKQGDSQTGVLYLKELLRVAKLVGLHDKPVSEDNEMFGKSVTVAVNACLKKWGYKENGIAGLNFARKLTAEIKKML